MAMQSKLTNDDITFLKNLLSDISAELCECECCGKEKGCSLFEKIYIAGNILYKKISDFKTSEYIATKPFESVYKDSLATQLVTIYDNNGIAMNIVFSEPDEGVTYNEIEIGEDTYDIEGNKISISLYDKDGTEYPLYDTIYSIPVCGESIEMFDDESCIDWNTIAKRINTDTSNKGKFVDKSRKKILSRFYKHLYDIIDGYENDTIEKYSDDYCNLTLGIFINAENVISQCLDECCN